MLQRAGVAAGVDAVRKWRLARRECERDAAYWTGRAGAEDASPSVLRKAAQAVRRLERHIAAGSKRLYRSRKHIERTGGPALIIREGARLVDGAIILPAARGETPLRLPSPRRSSPDGLGVDGRGLDRRHHRPQGPGHEAHPPQTPQPT